MHLAVGMGLIFFGIDWEVDWGVMDMMLSSIVPEVTQISQNCQKGVMEHNHYLHPCTNQLSVLMLNTEY